MLMHTLAGHVPPPCPTGSWSQEWVYGWRQPITAAAHAGHTLAVVIGWIIAVVARDVAVDPAASSPCSASSTGG